MRKYFLLIFFILSICFNCGYTIKGGVSYTVETVRTEAFSNVPLNINISDYQSHFIDPNYVANKNAMNKNKTKIRDRYFTFFSDKTYAIYYKKNKSVQFYYDVNGKLDFISFSINKKYPIKVLKYDKNGILDSTSLFVSNNESYVFDLNKKLIAHWKGNNCYNEKGELIMTREAK